MKTLADFKRRLTVGLSVTVEFPGSVIHGNTVETVLPARIVARKVHSVTPSYVLWQSESETGKAGSRLYWPKADCVTFPNANTASVSHEPDGKPFAVYRFA